MIELNEKVICEMNKYLVGTTVEELLVKKVEGREAFHFPVMFTKDQLREDVAVLDLSVRAYNCLKRKGFDTLDNLVNGVYTKDGESSKKQLLRIRNLGKNTADEILIKMFYYQFGILPDSRKFEYMQSVIEKNC